VRPVGFESPTSHGNAQLLCSSIPPRTALPEV
jgi:hypothetical protein